MCPYKYYDIMKNSKDKKQERYQMVVEGEKKGIKPTAREFRTTPNTVRRWMRRYKKEKYSGLENKTTRPKRSPRKTRESIEKQIIEAKKIYKRIGAEQVRYLERIPVASETIRRIWRKNNLSNRRRKKHETKNNLREEKKRLKFLEKVCEDTKELKDIPEYYAAMKERGTPQIQYTFRDVTSGTMYMGFANERSLTHATLFAEYIQEQLVRCGLNLSSTTRQTDNGAEYIGSWNAKEASSYTKVVESIVGQRHQTIPPKRHRYQADVETVHDIIEREWYEVETFNNRQEFMEKAYTYQLFFNLKRINTYKEHRTPWQIVKEKQPDIDMRVVLIPPVDLDALLKMRYSSFHQRVSQVLTNPLKF